MLKVLGCIQYDHDLRLVFIAVALCIFACWTAISLLRRARLNQSGRSRWTVCAAGVFGAGVWATHFVAMLAFHTSLPVGYDLSRTILSIVAAIGLSLAGFLFVMRSRPLPGSMLLGVGICAMHFIGMSGLRGDFVVAWDVRYVVLSVAVGMTFALAAVWTGTVVRNLIGRIASTALLVCGVCLMHFCGMSAMTLVPQGPSPIADPVLDPQMLAAAIAAVAALIVALGLIGAQLDEHLATRKTMEAERLRGYVEELEGTQRELAATSNKLRTALEKASAANEAKSAFLATMSHELRTPLNAVIGYTEFMLSTPFGPIGDRRYCEYLDDVHGAGVHLLSIINDILDLSKLDAGQVELREETISLPDLFDSVRCMMEGQARITGCRVRMVVNGDVTCIVADHRRLKQALLNLLSNAIKFTPAGGDVCLSAVLEQGCVQIAVSDTGIGIAEDDIPKALERFGQIDSRLSRKYEGTGLGLPLAKELVELHGGTLALESAVGSGTTVTITLPSFRTCRRVEKPHIPDAVSCYRVAV